MIVILTVLVLLPLNVVLAQNVTNSSNQIPSGAIRTSNGGWITPLQTTTDNGSKLTIHYETGIQVSGNYLSPGPPPVIHMNLQANSQIYKKGDMITISGKEDDYLIQNYGNNLTLSVDNSRTGEHWCCDNFQSSIEGSFYYVFKMPDTFQSSDNYNIRINSNNSTDQYGVGILYYDIMPYPLQQIRLGISTLDVECRDNLVHVIKSEDKSPACVKQDDIDELVHRGWAQPGIIPSKRIPHIVPPPLIDTGKPESANQDKTSSPLQLFLSIDSEYENPGGPVTIDVGLNNTGSVPLTLAKSDNWPRNDLSSGLCSNLPFGMSILKGYYTEQNMSSAKSLVIYDTVPCPLPTPIKSYTFESLNSKATQECDSLFSCPSLTDMKAHLVIPDFMYNGQHHSFDVGKYTIVGGDEWGHVVIRHFTEEYATAYSNPLGK